MYGLISLYLGYLVYLIIFLRRKRHDILYRKITIILGVKLLILTFLYFAFFSHKMTKVERSKNIQNLIINQY